MADDGSLNGIQVCVRVRPLNDRERDAGFRNCISFDEQTKQVVLMAVDKNTLMQLRGNSAKGYAFDRRYGPEHNSDSIYDDCVTHMVDNLFKGYNATVLAYGQTGSGKTLTMSGGTGIHGIPENGIIRRAAEHILGHVDAVKQKLKPGEAISVKAYALELYNEELRDLSSFSAAAAAAAATAAAGGPEEAAGGGSSSIRLSERPVGNGRCIPEVVGVNTVEVVDAEGLIRFFSDCFHNRAVGATKMNDRSSRSHAIYTVLINRTIVDVSDGGDKVRTSFVESRFNLVDLAGSERVKRSGVTGAAFKEAVHINSGLLALGNVIVALSGDASDTDPYSVLGPGGSPEGPPSGRSSPVKASKHVPYRDSKLTRLLQDSLGGNALTVLISCISSCEADFEETNSTLKYANRACRIKNQPLPNKQLLLEEDLLPLMPLNSGTGSMSVTQMQLLLTEHNRMKETRERREAEKKEREEKRMAELKALKEAERKTPGFQRLRMAQYDDLRKKLISSHGTRALKGEICDDLLTGFRKREEAESSDGSESPTRSGPSYTRPTTASAALGAGNKRASSRASLRTNSQTHLASIYGGAQGSSSSGAGGNRRTASTSSSPVPWESSPGLATGSSSDASPEVLTLQSNPASARETQEDVGVDTAGLQAEGPEQRLQQLHMGEASPTDAGLASTRSVSSKASKQLLELVDEGTCMTPHSPSTIRAFYAEVDEPTAAAAAVDAVEAAAAAAAAAAAVDAAADGITAERGSNGGRVSAASSSAYEVMEFQPAQAEPQVLEAPACDSQDLLAAEPVPLPQLLARFRVNQQDTLAVFKAVSVEDFGDVASLLPPNTALPAADKMTYLLARLEVQPQTPEQLSESLEAVAAGSNSMNAAVGPAVGCLMATFGTSLITDCIFDFDDPEQLQEVGLEQRLELWGLQIPHTSVRPALAGEPGGCSSTCSSPEPFKRGLASAGGSRPGTPQPSALLSCSSVVDQQQQAAQQAEGVTCWSSADRLNVSIGLMYALCNLAVELGAVAGFCVPRPQLLRRWLQAGVRMKQVSSPAKLIYPSSAHDYSYYKSSTVAYFMIDEIKASLCRVLCPPSLAGQQGS